MSRPCLFTHLDVYKRQAIQGRYGIPCVGIGPGAESQPHAPNEITWKQDLVTLSLIHI